ncbi:MAG: ferric reductase-like transmembrane domain-containing protein [Hyphomicrobiales bacterium]|nr:ferric reductase-like transmembrane domain-containing protein [Hyphomicrobiales bacterium]
MSAQYKPVIWNRNKLIYDAVLIALVAIYILTFVRLVPVLLPAGTDVDYAIRRMNAFGTCAFLMMTFILCIGPLARLDTRWLPLLYNRRHFGVLTCIVALIHANYVMGWYFAYSNIDPYVALLSINTSFSQIAGFPFELFGVFALAVLVMLAVTSHDFWLKFLQPKVWKALHMGIYAAYVSVIIHVAFGAMQSARTPTLALVVAFCACAVTGLHIMAAYETRNQSRHTRGSDPQSPWLHAAALDDIAEGRGLTVQLPGGDSVAIFRYDGKLSAISNACAHQNGPLGEGCIIEGLVTCPWHGYQYRPEDGCAPAPFTEKLATYRLKLDGDAVLLDPRPNAPGTLVQPLTIDAAGRGGIA